MQIYLLEKVVLRIIPALGASVAFLDMIILLRDARNANSTPYHEGLFRGTQFLMWVSFLATGPWQLYMTHLSSILIVVSWFPFVSCIAGYCSPCLKVWQLVWYFLQTNLVLLVDHETISCNSFSANSFFFSWGIFIGLLFLKSLKLDFPLL